MSPQVVFILIQQLVDEEQDPGMRTGWTVMKTNLGGLRVKFDQEEGLLTTGEGQEISHI